MGDLALLFPGQGAQGVGMGEALARAFPVARATFAEAEEVLGFPLARLCFEGPDEVLTETAVAQPALLTVGVAAWHVVAEETGVVPVAAAGHSLGEYTALVAAGALAFADAARLVRVRGEAMQEAVPAGTGAMAALLGLDADAVAAVCAEAARGDVVTPANLNGGGQVVISGARDAVERAVALAKARGAKRVIPLHVSAPFHCALMAPAAERLAAALEGVPISPLQFPVISNVDAMPHGDPQRVAERLVRQVTAPVRWEESVHCLARLGVRRALELGPGAVLGGLVRRITRDIAVTSVSDPEGVAALVGAPA